MNVKIIEDMNEDEVLAKIKELKAKLDYILESRKNPMVDSISLKELGYVWSLRLDTRYEYSLEAFTAIKETLGADNACAEYKRGLWLKLYFYKKQEKI